MALAPHPNASTLERFYSAFATLDAEAMASCYDPQVLFEDPAFSLSGRAEVAGMWRMLCDATRSQGLAHWRLEHSGIAADAHSGRAHWEAHYLFSSTGRLVHNRIDARFTFTPEGLIATHTDHFDFWRWSRQALGAPGWLLGWSPWMRTQVRRRAAGSLRKFMANRRLGAGT